MALRGRRGQGTPGKVKSGWRAVRCGAGKDRLPSRGAMCLICSSRCASAAGGPHADSLPPGLSGILQGSHVFSETGSKLSI